MTLCLGNCEPFIETIQILKISLASYTASGLPVNTWMCMLDKQCPTLDIHLLAEILLQCVGNRCEDRMECSDQIPDEGANMAVMAVCASNLMWHQPERGGWFIHSVIAAAGHCIASDDGERKKERKNTVRLMTPFVRTMQVLY